MRVREEEREREETNESDSTKLDRHFRKLSYFTLIKLTFNERDNELVKVIIN